MRLLIVESPSKAKTIEKYLEGAFTVRASVGHIRDLPKSNKKAIDIESGFIPHYEISKGKEKIVHELQALAHKATEVLLATDPDREGEAIAWHIEELLKKDNKIQASIERIVFHEITKEAIEEALKHPRKIDTFLRKAQEARRVLDRLVGYDLSGLIGKKVRYGLSAGRVQSPALRIIMEREREIRAFVPEKFWVVSAYLKKNPSAGESEMFTTICTEEPRTEKEAERIVKAAEAGSWNVIAMEESEQARTPRAPFTTSTLQQAASTRFGFSPSRTMHFAQKLYEAGHITYMRTDSPNLAKEAQANLLSVVKNEFGELYVSPRTYRTKAKTAQEAHEAVRPTDARKKSAGGNEEQKKLYSLIRARALASQMTDARIMRAKIIANISGETIPNFAATGSRVVFEGWLKADPAARGEDVTLPKVATGDALTIVEARSEGKETQPLSRYSEAGL